MADETHPESARAVLSDLDSFMTETDEAIRLLLEEFVAEGNEMTWALEALKCSQESLKEKVRDVRSRVFGNNGRGEGYGGAIAVALARSFEKKEELIVARLELCGKLLGGVPILKRKDCRKCEEQDPGKTDPGSGVPILKPTDCDQSSAECEEARESGVAGSPVKVLGSPPEEENLEAVLPETETETCVSLKEDLIDARLSNLCENPNGDRAIDLKGSESGEESGVAGSRVEVEEAQNEKPNEEHELTSDSDHSSDVSANTEEWADQVLRAAEDPVTVSSPQPLTPSIVSEVQNEKPNADAKLSRTSDRLSDVPARVLQPLTSSIVSPQAVIPPSERIVSFSELIRFIGRVDRKIESLLMGFKEGGRDSSEVEGTKISQDQLKDNLDSLTEVHLRAVDDGENLEVVVYSEMRMLALKALRRSLMEQERAIDARVDELLAASEQVTARGDCSKHLGKSDAEEQNDNGETFKGSKPKMSPVTNEVQLGSEGCQPSSDATSRCEDVADRKLTGFLDLDVSEEAMKADDVPVSLQKTSAIGLKDRAIRVRFRLSFMLDELFLSLPGSNQGSELEAVRSFVENIEREKSGDEAVKMFLQGLKVVEEELKKVGTPRPPEKPGRSSGTGEDKQQQLPEFSKHVEDLIKQCMVPIASVDAFLSCMSQFETRVWPYEAIHSLEMDMRDLEKQVQVFEADMEVLRSRLSYADCRTILDKVRNVSCP